VPWPEYDDTVREFLAAAGKDCWCDYKHTPQKAVHILEDPEILRNNSVFQIKTMLTYCVRVKDCMMAVGAQ
jgi:hypothetical protein